VVPNYALLGPLDASCEHIVMAPMPNGDRLLCYKLPEWCAPCGDRFTGMVTTEMDHILDRCPNQRAWVCRIPADDDPFRGRWHLPVGARARAHGQDAAAFVVEVPDETRVVSTHGLWGGHGRMLRQRWLETPIDDVRRDVEDALAGRSVARAEMFFRWRFYEHIIPIGAGEWGLPLVESGLLDLLERVAA
jgi:hypothetical protein